MKHHSDLINFIIKTFSITSYLEIGVFNKMHNFNLIKCPIKMCVDPDPNAKADFKMTSDDFFDLFRQHGFLHRVSRTHVFDFGLIFIDGLHHADQVNKDFNNAIACLSHRRSFIVMHDCNPHSEKITHVPRDNREWCGDVYKFAATLGAIRGIDFMTADFDYGCTIVWKDWLRPADDAVSRDYKNITWNYFDRNRQTLLNLMPVEEVKSRLLSLQDSEITAP